MRKRTDCGSIRLTSCSSGFALAAPRAVRIASRVWSTSARVTGSGWVRFAKASPAQSPMSECLRKIWPSRSSSSPDTLVMTLLTVDHPKPRVRRWDGLNARPLMKTAARRRSSSSSPPRYAARIRVFSRVAVVDATADPALAKFSIWATRCHTGGLS